MMVKKRSNRAIPAVPPRRYSGIFSTILPPFPEAHITRGRYWTSGNGVNSFENIPNLLEEFTAGMALLNWKSENWRHVKNN